MEVTQECQRFEFSFFGLQGNELSNIFWLVMNASMLKFTIPWVDASLRMAASARTIKGFKIGQTLMVLALDECLSTPSFKLSTRASVKGTLLMPKIIFVILA
jgi:hypothetical protein